VYCAPSAASSFGWRSSWLPPILAPSIDRPCASRTVAAQAMPSQLPEFAARGDDHVLEPIGARARL
jgi:hypothetical protein